MKLHFHSAVSAFAKNTVGTNIRGHNVQAVEFAMLNAGHEDSLYCLTAFLGDELEDGDADEIVVFGDGQMVANYTTRDPQKLMRRLLGLEQMPGDDWVLHNDCIGEYDD
jgi:hypothetical protein